MRDANVAAGCRQVAGAVQRGAPLDAALAANRHFPASLVPIIGWGQRHAALPDAFRAAAEAYEGQARTQSNLLEAIVPPIIFMLVVTVGLFFVIAMLVPLMQLLDWLAR